MRTEDGVENMEDSFPQRSGHSWPEVEKSSCTMDCNQLRGCFKGKIEKKEKDPRTPFGPEFSASNRPAPARRYLLLWQPPFPSKMQPAPIILSRRSGACYCFFATKPTCLCS